MSKKKGYFNEYNIHMGTYSYLPLVSGLLRSFAETEEAIKHNYEFMPFIYEMSDPAAIKAQYVEKPDIAAFSSMMWNERLNYCIAQWVKDQYPNCLIVFGGPNVPMPPQHDIEEWMNAHRFVDVAVRAEGEQAFRDILLRHIESDDFSNIPGVAFRKRDGSVSFCDTQRPHKRDLSENPSPYLEGMYDYLVAQQSENHMWQAIIETNRGCPFPCTFCYWGRGGLSRKYKYHDMERVFAEIDWMGKNKIPYVFNADSNFGMNSRDAEIAEFIVNTKRKYGFPDKFRTCFGKNTDDKIFKIGALFHANNLEKGITLARQSNDPKVLENIRRNNISMETYVNLQKRFNDQNIPVYGELILGLPGETVESWKRGVDELLEAGTKNQIYMYMCQVLTNTEMAEKPYREKFGLVTRRIPLAEIHGSDRPADWVTEYEEIIVQTNSMSMQEWRDLVRFNSTLMLLHSLKVAYYLMIFILVRYNKKMSAFLSFISDRKFTSVPADSSIAAELDFHDSITDRIINKNQHRGTVLENYGNFYWDVEEVGFLRLTQEDRLGKDNVLNKQLYADLKSIVIEFLQKEGFTLDTVQMRQIEEVMGYQSARIPSQSQLKQSGAEYQSYLFHWNLPEYFEKKFSTQEVPLVEKKQILIVERLNYQQNTKDYGRQTILWGRKSGTMLNKVTWNDADSHAP